MGYDRGDMFPFDFEPNGIPFVSENRKETCPHDHIPFNLKGNGNIVFAVYTLVPTRTSVTPLAARLCTYMLVAGFYFLIKLVSFPLL